jgi:hypothetical protein
MSPWKVVPQSISQPVTKDSLDYCPAWATFDHLPVYVVFACDDREMRPRGYDSDRIARFERWRTLLGLIVLVAFGPSVLECDSSAWTWFTAALWVVAVIWFACSAVAAWQTRHTPSRVYLPPTDVSLHDVQQIVHRVPERVSAVKALRESYPGLTLKDALDLVDAARKVNRPGTGSSSGDDQ